MRNKLVVALLIGACSSTALAAEEGSASSAACFLAGFRAGNADATTACYAPDAVLWIPGGQMAKGTQAIHDGFAGFFAANTVKEMTIAPMGMQMVGDDSVSWGTYRIVSVANDTKVESTTTGRYTDVSRRIDGKWLYVVDHASDDPPPAEAAK